MENERKLGNLYLYKVSDETKREFYHSNASELAFNQSLLHDGKSGNIHLFPEDPILARACADFIEQKFDQIKAELKLKKSENMTCTGSKNQKILNGISGGIYEGAKCLFAYLGIICNKGTENAFEYDLCFNRFFYDSEGGVNCVLPCFQIRIYDANKKEPLAVNNYPHTSKDGEGEEGTGVYYYNFEVDIHTKNEDIAKEFLKFIREKEKEKENKDQ